MDLFLQLGASHQRARSNLGTRGEDKPHVVAVEPLRATPRVIVVTFRKFMTYVERFDVMDPQPPFAPTARTIRSDATTW